MGIKERLLKLTGKDCFKLDENISTGYLLLQCWKYGWMMVRGRIFSLGYSRIAGSVFIGKKVRVLEKKRLSIGTKTKLHDGVYIDALSAESALGVFLGEYVVLGRNTRIECTGGLSSVGHGIHIGNRTTFGSDCFFGAAGGIEIGDDVVAGQYIRFHSENHCFKDINRLIKDQGVTHKGIRIGDNCWIGAGVVFLDGAVLGNGCVVAANAVVGKKFPDNVVIGGVPAKILKYRTGQNSER